MDDLIYFLARIAFWFYVIYTILPFLLTRVLSLFVWKKVHTSPRIAFTFDDGPDPKYTPQLLDLLKEYDVPAVFFVVGDKAQRNPDLIRRMQAEGHLLAIHGYKHLPNWLLAPWVSRRHVRQTAEILKNIAGVQPTLYRPTWGLLNFTDMFLLHEFQIVLWSCMVGDWRTKVGRTSLRQKLLKGIHRGTIVVLHDSGETFGADEDAPQYMIEALRDVLSQLKAQGHSFERVDRMLAAEAQAKGRQLSLFKRILVALWMQWEKLFTFVFRVQKIEGSNDFIHLRLCKYPGQTMTLEDGSVIRKGDLVAELHFDNRQLFEMGSKSRSMTQLAILMIRGAQGMFPKIAETLANDPKFREAKGLYGVTMINRGVQEFGLSVFDLPKGLFAWSSKLYLRLLLAVIHPQGKKRLKQRSELLVPKLLLASRAEILRRFPVQQREYAVAPTVAPTRKPLQTLVEQDEEEEHAADLSIGTTS